MSVNKVMLIGNLGADPENRSTASGTSVTNLRLATTERRKDASGEWSDHTEWHRVVCFGKTAENVSQYLSKGRQIFVEGRLRTNKWQDRDGNDRWTTEVIADQIRFLGTRASSDHKQDSRKGGGYNRNNRNTPYGPQDNVPF